MVDVVFTSDFTTRYDIAVSNTRFIVEEAVLGETGSDPSINEKAGMTDNVIIIKGALWSQNYGLALGSCIFALTACEIVNHGVIATKFGITVPANSTITNSGEVFGISHGIKFSDESVVHLTKTSLLTTDNKAIIISSTAGHETQLANHGLIAASRSTAISAASGDDVVINRGEIRGLVQLGGGNDTFDNRGGIFEFSVEGGAGDDVYRVSNNHLNIVELAAGGNDTVRSTVSLSLSSAHLTGDEIENLVLLGQRNLRAAGSILANDLMGNAGNNVLIGMGGADRLDGGRGNDRLTGGPDGDTFVFKTGSGHDVITKFEVGLDIVDLRGVSGIDNLTDLKNHHAEKHGSDLVLFWNSDEVRIQGAGNADLDDIQFLFA
jgi:Ca2+-binding RTX toxin-like protein